MGRLAATLLVGAALVALAVPALAIASLAATPVGLQQKHTNADMASAARVSLTLGDVALGWTSAPAPTTEQSLICAAWHPDLTGVVETGAATSESLQGGKQGPFVSESAWIYQTAGQAGTLWNRVVGPKLLSCLAAAIEQGSTRDVRFKIRSEHVLEAPGANRPRAAYRVVATAATSGQSVTTYYDVIVLASGRAVAELTFARIGAPMSPATERTLSGRVASRLGKLPG